MKQSFSSENDTMNKSIEVKTKDNMDPHVTWSGGCVCKDKRPVSVSLYPFYYLRKLQKTLSGTDERNGVELVVQHNNDFIRVCRCISVKEQRLCKRTVRYTVILQTINNILSSNLW